MPAAHTFIAPNANPVPASAVSSRTRPAAHQPSCFRHPGGRTPGLRRCGGQDDRRARQPEGGGRGQGGVGPVRGCQPRGEQGPHDVKESLRAGVEGLDDSAPPEVRQDRRPKRPKPCLQRRCDQTREPDDRGHRRGVPARPDQGERCQAAGVEQHRRCRHTGLTVAVHQPAFDRLGQPGRKSVEGGERSGEGQRPPVAGDPQDEAHRNHGVGQAPDQGAAEQADNVSAAQYGAVCGERRGGGGVFGQGQQGRAFHQRACGGVGQGQGAVVVAWDAVVAEVLRPRAWCRRPVSGVRCGGAIRRRDRDGFLQMPTVLCEVLDMVVGSC